MALLTAYAKLQLDPDDHSRMAAFEALCWHHIFKHGPRDWIIGCRNGFIKLQLWTSKTSNTQGFKSFDSTLNKIVFNFVHAYAAVIWPTDDTKRSHLALVDDKYHGTELKALQWQLGVSQGIKRRFKEIQDLDLTAEDAMVESKIGQRVRVYLMSLLLSKQSIPEKQPTAAGELLQMFLNPPDPQAYAQQTRICHHHWNLAPSRTSRFVKAKQERANVISRKAIAITTQKCYS
jgi:hypothetical protein